MIFQHHIASITSSAAVYGRPGCSSSTASSMDVQGIQAVLNLQGVSQSYVCSVDMQDVCISFFKYRNAGLFGILIPKWTKNTEAGTSSVPEKGDPQSGTRMLRYWNKRPDAGMPMPAASATIPMPSYVDYLLWKIPVAGLTFEHEFIKKLVTNCFCFPSFYHMAWV